MDISSCFHCSGSLSEGNVVCVSRGLPGLQRASELRGDGLRSVFQELERNGSFVKVHVDCRKAYIRPTTITKDKKENVIPQPLSDTQSAPTLRSSLGSFNTESDCLFCGEEASLKVETKKHCKYRRVIHDVATVEFKQSVLERADARQDEWGEIVRARALCVFDLFAADAKYHHECHRDFFCGNDLAGDGSRGRREDPDKKIEFLKLCSYIVESDDCQFSMSQLENLMSEKSRYSRKHLQEKLNLHFGDSIFITELPGKQAVLNLKRRAGEILYDKWYTERSRNPVQERLRVVEAAAKILLEDIRGQVYDVDTYPSPDSDLDDDLLLPATLQCLMKHIIKAKSENEETVKRKRAAIGQSIVSACRPRSFVSPILLGVGVYVHRHYESKELVEKLHKLSFSVDYAEVRRYEYSAMMAWEAAALLLSVIVLGFRHFAFDNADFNVRTMTGHGTFHSLGGVRFRSKHFGESVPTPPFPRVRNPPPATTIATKGTIPILWFKMPSKPGLKGVTVQDLKAVSKATARSVSASLRQDLLCLAGLWAGVPSPPSWNGFMRAVASGEVRCIGTKVEPLPFINLNASDLSSLYTAMKFAQEECRKIGQKNCAVTFDQPLFSKASEIVAVSSPELDNVIVRLGGFHLLMSYLGSIGYIMAGSGLEELWGEVYAKSSVAHMLTGHAYSRALRAHFLTETVLITMLLEDMQDVQELKGVLSSIILEAVDGKRTAEELARLDAIRRLHAALNEKRSNVSKASRTAKLWSQYLSLVELIRLFIRAERTGDWELHLFCVREMIPYFHAAGHFAYAKSAHLYHQKMSNISSLLTEKEFEDFVTRGQFSVWRKSDAWGGVWSDMSIEQDLMRNFKIHGGMTHTRGVTDSSLAYFVLAFPACLNICSALERLTGNCSSSSEQHVDLRQSRRTTDSKHTEIFRSWLSERSPWEPAEHLHSLSSGVIGDKSINCDEARTVGENILKGITGTFGDIKLSRKNRVLPLSAVSKSVKIRDEVVPVDTRQLFNRLVWVINTRGGDLKESLKYELAPKPPALFDDFSLRKTAKSALLQLFSFSPASDDFSEATMVIDGGYLLHAVVWPRPATYGSVVSSYTSYIVKHFSATAHVVFDGYKNSNMSTKFQEQRRRAGKKSSSNLVVEVNNSTSTSQSDFLSNPHNKTRLISLMSKHFRNEGLSVTQAEGDADTLIVSTALQQLSSGHDVTVVANDTDILVMLLARAKVPSGKKLNVLHPGSSKVPGKIYDVGKIQNEIGRMKECVLFVHAVSGSDTTSSFFNKGKKKAWKALDQNPDLRTAAAVFTSPTSTKQQVIAAGEEFAMKLYTNESFASMDELRCNEYARTLTRHAAVHLENLPPTSAACKQHSLRTYLQVQEWLENRLPPTDWGWAVTGDMLVPVPTELPPAPDFLLNLISCGCKSECGPKCSCRTAGLPCTMMCAHCRGRSCCNSKPTGSTERTTETEVDEQEVDDPTYL